MSESQTNQRTFVLVALCFLLSGFAALIYETVWLRQFAILLGTTEQALAIVLSSYMGGLSIGAFIIGRVTNRIRKPLFIYGLLELGIAVAALLVPLGLTLVQNAQAQLFGGLVEPPSVGGWKQGIFTLGSVMGLIAIPTALMGATLPLLARYAVRTDQEVGSRIGLLYCVNTFGAVAGTLVAAFVCLPTLGLSRTTFVGVGINALVFALVVALVRSSSREENVIATAHRDETPSSTRSAAASKLKNRRSVNKIQSDAESLANAGYILPMIAVSGAISFCYEIVFTRMISHFLGGSVFAFATMLAGFLLGIALGSGVATRFARSRSEAVVGFVYAQSLAPACSLFAFFMVDYVAGAFELTSAGHGWFRGGVAASILILLPTAICIGATLPFAIRIFAKGKSDAASGSALVYGWNVIGGIAGALVTGVLLMPTFEYHGTELFAAIANIALALTAAFLFKASPKHLAAPAVAVVFLALFFPKTPERILRVSAIGKARIPGEMMYNHVGKSATVSVFYDKGDVSFVTNGLPEARLLPRDSGLQSQSTAGWLTALPPLINPRCESMLVIGLGGGAAVENVAPSVQVIDVMELEPAVIEANQRVAGLRTNDPLADPRLKIILNDGRNALLRTSKQYDAIVSQPSHPWTAGASHLYTLEFAEIVRDRLRANGVFLQWMSSEFIDPDLLASMAATLRSTFGFVRLYEPFAGTLLFVASDSPMAPERDLAGASRGDPRREFCRTADVDREYYRRLGVLTRTHLLSMLALDDLAIDELVKGAPLISDERNLLAMRAPKLIRQPRKKELEEFIGTLSPVTRGRDALTELCPTLDVGSLVKRYKMMGLKDRYESAVFSLGQSPKDLAYHRWLALSGSAVKHAERLSVLVAKYPTDSRFAYESLRYSMLGLLPRFSAERVDELKRTLTPEHLVVIECVEAMIASDWETIRMNDDALAAISVDDIAHEGAILSRMPWRMEAPAQEAFGQGQDMLRIIDRNSAFMHPGTLAWFRVEGAIRARQPWAALGTASAFAKNIQHAIADGKSAIDVGNVTRIQRTLMNQSQAFATVPRWRYRETVELLNGVMRSMQP